MYDCRGVEDRPCASADYNMFRADVDNYGDMSIGGYAHQLQNSMVMPGHSFVSSVSQATLSPMHYQSYPFNQASGAGGWATSSYCSQPWPAQQVPSGVYTPPASPEQQYASCQQQQQMVQQQQHQQQQQHHLQYLHHEPAALRPRAHPQEKKRCCKCECPNCLQPGGNKTGKHRCSFAGCQLQYAKTSHLKAHIRTHNGEKPFVCLWPGCSSKFTRSDELTRHTKIHTGEKNFKCALCSKGFMRSDHLAKHRKTHDKPKKQPKQPKQSASQPLHHEPAPPAAAPPTAHWPSHHAFLPSHEPLVYPQQYLLGATHYPVPEHSAYPAHPLVH